MATAGAARAQVLEIDASGGVTIYDRPAVITAAGAAPIIKAVAITARPAPAEVARHLADAATAYQMDGKLLEAVAWQESRFRQTSISPKGAAGVMQLMPQTARDLGVDSADVRQNVFGGAAYLKAMLNRFGGDTTLALAAYNAGPGAVLRYGGIPPYAETRSYVAAVTARAARQIVQATTLAAPAVSLIASN